MIDRSTNTINSDSADSKERAQVRLSLLCPICRNREALLRYSRRDTGYVVCSCGVRFFIWDTEAEDLMLKRVQDYGDAKTSGKLDEYRKAQIAGR